LEGDVSLDDLKEGIKPGHTTVNTSSGSEYDTVQYNSDMQKIRKTVFSSHESNTSNYSSSGEMGQTPPKLKPPQQLP